MSESAHQVRNLQRALPTWRRSAPVRAVGLAAPPAALVPAELQSVIAVKGPRGRVTAEPFTGLANTPQAERALASRRP
ncbi:hypothetical protein MBT84_02805 [Streptomyces sp. MBT84]|nr:hypothetical protein [Streptomyces sp. MBT84]